MADIYKNIEDYNPNKKQKILIALNSTHYFIMKIPNK